MPDFSIEDSYPGICCGLDEVGRGPLAGPVVAACVIIPHDLRTLEFISEIADSKKLSPSKRDILSAKIIAHFPYSIAEISPQEIDKINILQASLRAMEKAYHTMPNIHVDMALVDGNRAPALPCQTVTVTKGDSKSVTVAAASIIAKVYRDKIMKDLDLEYPAYGWAKNAGYPTQHHRDALLISGVTRHHRKSFAPVRRIIDSEQ